MNDVKQKDVAVVPKAEITPMDMLNMAVQQNADLDKLEKLMALQERWEANEAKKAYVRAMTAFKADPPELFKNKHVRYETSKGVTEYNHPSLDHVANTLAEAMSKHGLSFTWETEQGEGGLIKVSCIITHEQGHSERVSLQSSPDQSGGKNNIQAVGSAVKYLQRYTLEAAAGVATKDRTDDDAQTAEPVELITEEQANTLHSLATETETLAGFEAWLKTIKIDSISQIRADKYDYCLERLNNAITARQEKAKKNAN